MLLSRSAPVTACVLALFALTACQKEKVVDNALLYSRAAMSRDADDFSSFWSERVVEPEGHSAYLDANGGASTLLRIKRRTT